ncbi:MAG: putative Trans-aconitate 2-methyltransferase [Phycisphaerales bacterium]|nr:putative Trans-aconitate 2-methyltransferase [Phycisphaerales bacterium]MDB5305450.1 putative Trans-aconitate 2-methyltransferase [Phycisphaerales bacterium]
MTEALETIPDPANPARRPLESSTELNTAELAWWEKFAELEERFCWVQTPAIQRFLRGRYVRRIVELTPPGGRIADLGCGAGWLAVLLGKLGARQVVGTDFSPAQIARARKLAAESGVADRVIFEVAEPADIATGGEAFDVVIVHAFLHHLSVNEIKGVLAQAHGMLRPGGKLVIFEPVQYPPPPPRPNREDGRSSAAKWRDRVYQRSGLASGLGRFNRKPSGAEQQVRETLAGRSVGELPHGPSPKEMAFAPDEIPALVAGQFRLVTREPCLSKAHWVAQENLLMELSSPLLARALRWPLLAAARFFDRRACKLPYADGTAWVFEMFVCEPL